MTKIKVAHVLHSIGGVDISLRLILENIDTEKFENIVIHGQIDTKKIFTDKNHNEVKSYRLPIFRDISVINDIKSVFKTYKIIKQFKPNLIHAHSAKGGVIGRLAAKWAGVPVLYTPQAFSYLSTESRLKRKIFLMLEYLLANGRTKLLASSPSENERGINEVGFKPQNTILFNNSVNPIEHIKPLTIAKTWPDNYICTVGRPSYQKNIELMLEAVHIIKQQQDIHLVLLGVGIVQDRIGSVLSLIDTLGLKDNVTMIEWTDRDNILNILSNAQLYISTARYEGLPYSVIESLALGKPCVVSNCDGNKDLVKDGYNGFVITSGNPEEYAQKTMQLLNDNNLQAVFSGNAKKTFDANYDLRNNIANLEEIYKQQAKQAV